MSTFDGLVEEFPDIRIDYFRNHSNKKQPAACFLSHVHSDHLLGLDTLKMPFVYCSTVTRQLLLRMEKYPHRINFAKGVLEARKQTYRHLKSILRPLPLHTPIDLELGPKSRIRVALFDANHCPGAVMFLIEGHGRAILYTGDVRAEPWWVNSIVRNPLLIPYTNGQKCLDCMYLDTTFASHRDIYREFPTKAEGLSELLRKLSEFPADSQFYFRAWTLGYEDVWIAISNLLDSKIHVDQYQLRLFRSITEDGLAAEPGPALAGTRIGNSEQSGCLTLDPDVRIHSCEPGMPCHSALSKSTRIVWITPIISRLPDGSEVAEVGAGGGRGDLQQSRELEVSNDTMLQALRVLISSLADDQTAADRLETLISTARNQRDHRIMFDNLGTDPATEISVSNFIKSVVSENFSMPSNHSSAKSIRQKRSNVVHFPYSRHSSYSELCNLVQSFRPRDICPCTVDIDCWTEELSIESLFGKLCSTSLFKYDRIIRSEAKRRQRQSATTTDEAISQPYDTQRTDMQTVSQASDDVFRSVREGTTAQDMKVNDAPPAQVQVEYEGIVAMVQSAWLDANGGQEMRRSTRFLKLSAETTSIATTVSSDNATTPDQAFYTHVTDTSEDLEFLEDLPEFEDMGSRPSKRLRMSRGENSLVTEGKGRVDASTSPKTGDVECRREAFEAARLCLEEGDTSLWTALNLRSIDLRDHQTGSPEL